MWMVYNFFEVGAVPYLSRGAVVLPTMDACTHLAAGPHALMALLAAAILL